jgi:hypothetical protein
MMMMMMMNEGSKQAQRLCKQKLLFIKVQSTLI